MQEKSIEISKLKHEVQTAIDSNHNLQTQKRNCEEELAGLRERNRIDL